MFQPLLANKRQENVNLPGWGINHRSADFVVHQLNTLNARNEFIATPHSSEDNLKFWKNDWEFGFITEFWTRNSVVSTWKLKTCVFLLKKIPVQTLLVAK